MTNPWPELSRENRAWTRWWWLGSAVDEAGITRELAVASSSTFLGMSAGPYTQIDVYRRMTSAERVKTGCALHGFAHQRMVLFLSRKHPNKSPAEVLRMAAGRFLHDTAGVL